MTGYTGKMFIFLLFKYFLFIYLFKKKTITILRPFLNGTINPCKMGVNQKNTLEFEGLCSKASSFEISPGFLETKAESCYIF